MLSRLLQMCIRDSSTIDGDDFDGMAPDDMLQRFFEHILDDDLLTLPVTLMTMILTPFYRLYGLVGITEPLGCMGIQSGMEIPIWLWLLFGYVIRLIIMLAYSGFFLFISNKIKSAFVTLTAVSYTHLDVYKRQVLSLILYYKENNYDNNTHNS